MDRDSPLSDPIPPKSLPAPVPGASPDRRARVRRLQAALDEFDDPDWP